MVRFHILMWLSREKKNSPNVRSTATATVKKILGIASVLQHVEHMAPMCFHFDFCHARESNRNKAVVYLLFTWLLEMLFGYFIEQTNNQRCQALLFFGCNSEFERVQHTHGCWHTTKYVRNIRYYDGFGYCYSKSVNRNENHHTQIHSWNWRAQRKSTKETEEKKTKKIYD